MLGVTKLESSFAENNLGVLVGTKVECEPAMCALLRRRLMSVLGCTRRSVASRSRQVLRFYSALVRPYLEYCV